MPTVSNFYGMTIKMFFARAEHNPPHIHVIYGEYAGLFDIETAAQTEGDLPARAKNLVTEWINRHKAALLDMWNTQNFRKLPPLE